MEKKATETEIGYETNDFIPGTDVLAVESKETGQDQVDAERELAARVALDSKPIGPLVKRRTIDRSHVH
jgi:hypothetical protein